MPFQRQIGQTWCRLWQLCKQCKQELKLVFTCLLINRSYVISSRTSLYADTYILTQLCMRLPINTMNTHSTNDLCFILLLCDLKESTNNNKFLKMKEQEEKVLQFDEINVCINAVKLQDIFLQYCKLHKSNLILIVLDKICMVKKTRAVTKVFENVNWESHVGHVILNKMKQPIKSCLVCSCII